MLNYYIPLNGGNFIPPELYPALLLAGALVVTLASVLVSDLFERLGIA